MGEVYRATDSVLERTVAVKLLSDHYASQEDARARFRREALAAARLSAAPNVVTVFDVAEHRGRPLIVMEYLEGGSVYERMRDARIPRETALAWLEQVAVAIDRAHENGVVHRDVKPANLLLDDEGNVHVSDFGIASTSGADALTAPGTVLGTAGYLAPEQARGEPATAASDLYALGVVAFELLTGRRPFAGDTPATEAFAHLNADVPRATPFDPTLPTAVDDVFQSALAKEPQARPANAQELVRRLREALETEDTASAPTVVDAGASTRTLVYRSRRPRGALIALGITGLLVVGFLVAALTGAGDEPGRDASRRVRGLECRRFGGERHDGLGARWCCAECSWLRPRAGGQLRLRSADPEAGRARSQGGRHPDRGVRKLQPRLRAVRRGPLRRRHRVARSFRGDPGPPRRDRRLAPPMAESLRSRRRGRRREGRRQTGQRPRPRQGAGRLEV